jgi:hypothetical protein
VTGELLPPGAPDGAGDPEVHSPAGHDVLDGPPATADVRVPAQGGPSSVTVQDGDVRITVTADGGAGDGIEITLTDGDGDSTRYELRMADDRRPEPVPAQQAIEPAAQADTGAHGSGAAVAGQFAVNDIQHSLNPAPSRSRRGERAICR